METLFLKKVYIETIVIIRRWFGLTAECYGTTMNKAKMLNLAGRLTHALVGLALFQQANMSGARTYIKDFLSLNDNDVHEAFGFMPSKCRQALVDSLMKRRGEFKALVEAEEVSIDMGKNIDATDIREVLKMIYTILGV